MRRIVMSLVAATMLVLLPAGAALAQDYPPTAATVTVSDTTVVPGQTIVLAGDGWLPGSEVTITLFSEPRVLGTATVDGDGAFSTRVTIPSDVSPGTSTLRISGIDEDGRPANIDLTITVVAAPDPDVAVTGSTIGLSLALATGLLVVGGLALYAARRQRNRVDG